MFTSIVTLILLKASSSQIILRGTDKYLEKLVHIITGDGLGKWSVGINNGTCATWEESSRYLWRALDASVARF